MLYIKKRKRELINNSRKHKLQDQKFNENEKNEISGGCIYATKEKYSDETTCMLSMIKM